jgi:cysteine synthase
MHARQLLWREGLCIGISSGGCRYFFIGHRHDAHPIRVIGREVVTAVADDFSSSALAHFG